MKLSSLLLLIALICAPFTTLAKQNAPNVLLAQEYKTGIDVTQYLISEKFDGVRAIWDGSAFHTRQGNVIHAPEWFTKNLPKTPLDGELWLGRGQFDALSGAVRKDVPIMQNGRELLTMFLSCPMRLARLKCVPSTLWKSLKRLTYHI